MAGLLEQLDGAISELLAGWNVYTTLIAFGILGYVGWVIYDTADADTHPLLLARQAQASYVRQPGESAVFRSPETPHGCTMSADIQILYADPLQILFVPDLPSSLQVLPCTRLAKMAIYETFGAGLQAKFLSSVAHLPAALLPS